MTCGASAHSCLLESFSKKQINEHSQTALNLPQFSTSFLLCRFLSVKNMSWGSIWLDFAVTLSYFHTLSLEL